MRESLRKDLGVEKMILGILNPIVLILIDSIALMDKVSTSEGGRCAVRMKNKVTSAIKHRIGICFMISNKMIGNISTEKKNDRNKELVALDGATQERVKP